LSKCPAQGCRTCWACSSAPGPTRFSLSRLAPLDFLTCLDRLRVRSFAAFRSPRTSKDIRSGRLPRTPEFAFINSISVVYQRRTGTEITSRSGSMGKMEGNEEIIPRNLTLRSNLLPAMHCQFRWLCLNDSAVSNAVACSFILRANGGPHLVHITPGICGFSGTSGTKKPEVHEYV